MLSGLIKKLLPVLFFAFAVAALPALAANRDASRPAVPPAAQVPGVLPDSSMGSSSSNAGNPASHAATRSSSGVLLAPPKPIVIPRLTVAPVFNDFLSTPVRPAAAQMLRITHFVERYPKDGAKPSNRTVAFVGYTHRYLFVAFLCYAQDPKLVRAHFMARDSLGDDDKVKVMLDTFHDKRRAFVFETNARGIQADALYTEQTGYDFSFDTVWDTWGRRTPWGYAGR